MRSAPSWSARSRTPRRNDGSSRRLPTRLTRLRVVEKVTSPELDAKHADADARAAVLDEVTALHQQWEREQEERERVARDTVEVAEAAERSATEQTARAKVELAAMERARRAFEASEAALDERERKLAHTWRTIRGDAHRISEASYRASIGARSVRMGRIPLRQG